MSQNLTIDNYDDINIKDTARLDADSIAGAASLTVRDSAGTLANDYILVGTPGSFTSEIAKVSAIPSSTQYTLTPAAIYAHTRFDTIKVLFGNQIKIYRAANTNGLQPADSSFATIATIPISANDLQTNYTDAVGSNAYWYKFTYYNSTSTNETSLADSRAARGGGSGAYCSLEDIRVEAGFKNATYITDSMIESKRQEAQSIIDTSLGGLYTVPFAVPINPFIAGITKRLAAGYLLLQQYGSFGTLNTQNGQSKVDKAMADLKWLQSSQGTLKDANGASQVNSGSGGMKGIPNATTADTVSGLGGFKFTIDQRY